jgi:sugar transferase (PEP-CTERM/EpsH1 system associated)
VSCLAEILFLAHRIPFPPTKGDKIRAHNFLTHLARNHTVHLGCFVDEVDDWRHVEQLRGLCHECHFAALPPARVRWRALTGLARNQAVSVAARRDSGLASWIADLLRRRPVKCVFAYSGAMAQFLGTPPTPVPRRIVDFVDVDSEKWRRLGAQMRWPASWLHRRESARLRVFDQEAVGRCDVCLFVSRAEARAFQELIPAVTAKVRVVPNGVDHAYFSPEDRHPPPLGTGGPIIAFTGDMSYRPNQDAVLWFAREILPEVLASRPGVRFVVVGRRPSSRLRRAGAHLSFALTGTVPDVRPYLSQAAVVVAPLRIAQGVPNKVLEAMAMAKAVVATSAAAAGLELQVGQDILVADHSSAFAAAVTAALDPALAARVGANARARVVADYPWAASLSCLERLILDGRGDASD